MPFAYYQRLSRAEQAVYRRSDGIHVIRLPGYRELRPTATRLGEALAAGDRRAVAATATELCDGITRALEVPSLEVRVLEVRPASRREELHGLYTVSDSGRARIRVWMRTARHGRVVAFKTFLRTLLHEVCHHLDYEFLDLNPSFHTEGFFKRESSLFHQLAPEVVTAAPPAPPRPR